MHDIENWVATKQHPFKNVVQFLLVGAFVHGTKDNKFPIEPKPTESFDNVWT